MKRIFEFFTTLWNHRKMISELQVKVVELQLCIRVRDLALESLSISIPEDLTINFKPIRLTRSSYAEAQNRFERQNSARFRIMDAKTK